MPKQVTRTERGWAGHFICAEDCLFRRNTLLQCGDVYVVVSTVGALRNPSGDGFSEIGYQHHYETAAFYSKPGDSAYHDADVTSPVDFLSRRTIKGVGGSKDNEANAMHEAVVAEVAEALLK